MTNLLLKNINNDASITGDISEITHLVKDELDKANKIIINNIESNVPLVPKLAKHLVNSGGKRIRPLLTILSSKLCNYNNGDRHIHMAACVEFIHMATLLHDDVIDGSFMRRGVPTANNLWGNKSSVLVGDFLFSKAFQLMVKDGSLKILNVLSEASSILAQGEVMQLSITNNIETSIENCFSVIEDKTAKLFEAATHVGGIISSATEDQNYRLSEYGKSIGIAFQLIDDAMDYNYKNNKTGKKAGADFKEGKITLPVIIAIQKATKKEKLFWKKVMEDLEQDETDFMTAIKLINKYNAISQTIEKAQEYSNKAIKLIKTFPNNSFRNSLEKIANFSVSRQN